MIRNDQTWENATTDTAIETVSNCPAFVEHVDTFTGGTFIAGSDERLLFDAFQYSTATDEDLRPLHCGPLLQNFSREESSRYFSYDYHGKRGAAYLVSKCFYNGSVNPLTIAASHLSLFLQFVLLIQSLNTRQNKLLGTFLSLLFTEIDKKDVNEKDLVCTQAVEKPVGCPNCQCNHCSSAHELQQFEDTLYQNRSDKTFTSAEILPYCRTNLPPIPKSFAQIRSTVLTGKKSFLNNLAYPKILMSHGHAYCLPSDCIKHFLAQGNEPLIFDKSQHTGEYSYANETPRGLKISNDLNEAFPGNLEKHLHMS
jgi:hypothetical protein